MSTLTLEPIGRGDTASLDTVLQWVRAKTMKESLGLSPFAGDLNKMPAKLVDAFTILNQEHSKVERLNVVSSKPESQKR